MDLPEAFAYVDYYKGIPIYAVLNHLRSSKELISKLGETYLKVHSIMPRLEQELPDKIITAQIYPDFDCEEWRYLFIPTEKGFLNHMDRIYDLRKNEVINIASNKEFIERFKPEIDDKYKFIVTFERNIF